MSMVAFTRWVPEPVQAETAPPPAHEHLGRPEAFLLLSFGGPEGPEDVMPFLENVVRGRGVPRQRLEAVAEHYYHFGGVSPINDQNRALLAAIKADFAATGLDLPVYWGNRNWDPYLSATLEQLAADGVTSVLALATSAYSSFSGCRQYREDVAAAAAHVGPDAPAVFKLRHFFNHPGFIAPQVDAVRAALTQLPERAQRRVRLVFTAHSIPVTMNEVSGPTGGLYATEVAEAARLVAQRAAPEYEFEVAWQSRSGPPHVPWLEPDINDRLAQLPAEGVTDVVVCPVGFICDHLEVIWDLDHEANQTATELGLGYARAATPGTDARFVRMITQLVTEQITPGCPRLALGPMGPSHDVCPPGCCREPVAERNPA